MPRVFAARCWGQDPDGRLKTSHIVEKLEQWGVDSRVLTKTAEGPLGYREVAHRSREPNFGRQRTVANAP